MNRSQRRAYDKRNRQGSNPPADGMQRCPFCLMPSNFIMHAHPQKRGECVPVCIRCGKIVGDGQRGVAPGAPHVIPDDVINRHKAPEKRILPRPRGWDKQLEDVINGKI